MRERRRGELTRHPAPDLITPAGAAMSPCRCRRGTYRGMRTVSLPRIAASAAALLIATPAWSQTAPGTDIDQLLDASASPDGAMSTARGQIDAGNLTGAAATLERALLAHPDPTDEPLRLTYIQVLCRLDDHRRAAVELLRVDGTHLSDSDWAATTAACGPLTRPAAAARASDTTVNGQIGIGLAYDSDLIGALSTVFTFPGAPHLDDGGLSVLTTADVRARFAAGGSGFAYAGVEAISKDSISGPYSDFQLGTLHLGGGVSAGSFDLSAGLVGSYARIFNHDFYGEYGGEAAVAFHAGARNRLKLEGLVVHQNYSLGVPVFFDRDGTRYDAALTWHGEAPRFVYEFGGAYENKTANTRYLGWEGYRLYAGARAPLTAGGVYAGLSGTYRYVDYRDAPFVQDDREDRYFVRAAFGVPLNRHGLAVEAGASYQRRHYRDDIFTQDYSSVGGDLRLVWNFGQF